MAQQGVSAEARRGVVHGVAPAVIIAVALGFFMALVYAAAILNARRAAATAAPIQLPVRGDTSSNEVRKVA